MKLLNRKFVVLFVNLFVYFEIIIYNMLNGMLYLYSNQVHFFYFTLYYYVKCIVKLCAGFNQHGGLGAIVVSDNAVFKMAVD